MKIDLKELRETISREVEEENSSSQGSGNGYRIVYPFQDGKLTLRILYNLKGKVVQRKLVRHNKIPCLQAYGEECPVCKAINEAETLKGKECGAFSKYGYKTRGICYAQVVDASDNYLKNGDDSIKKGDIIIFMYPKSLYEKLNKIMLDAAEHLGDIVASNKSIPIVVERSTKKGGFPDYTVSLYPYGASEAFTDADGKTGEELFEEALDKIPNILEDIVPQYPTDEVRTGARALADTVIEEFVNSNVTNPGEPTDLEAPNNSPVSDDKGSIADSVSEPKTVETTQEEHVGLPSDLPPCFGKYSEDNRQCMLCLKEVECLKSSSNK